MNAIAPLAAQLKARFRSGSGRAVLWSFAAAVAARLGHLVLAVLLARQLGPTSYGTFTFATGIAMLAGQMSSLGWPILMNRLMPGLLKDRNWSRLKGLRNAGDAVVIISSLVVGAFLYGLGTALSELENGFKLAALLTVPLALTLLRRQQLAAMGRAAIGLMFDQGFGAIVLVIIILLWGAVTVEAAIVQYACATGIGIVITTILFRRGLPRELASVRPSYELRVWAAMALPMIIGQSAKLLMHKIDILMLAPLSDLHEVGLYGAAFRVTYLLSFPQVVLMSVFTPLFSQAFTNRNIKGVRRILKWSLLFACVTTVPAAAAILLVPELVMGGVFGPEFREAAPTLAVLTVAQLAGTIAIPYSAVLMMGGRERAFGAWNFGALGANILLCFLLIPAYGALGAAYATLVSALFLMIGQILLSRPLLSLPRQA